MKSDIYKKDLSKLPFLPSLEDYEEAHRLFSWRQAKTELSWFGDKLNAAYNAVDRHTQTWRKNKVALYWEDEEGNQKKYTFEELSVLSNKLGNILKDFGVERGDRVFIFLPRIPELYFSFLGILKIGAIAGTLFSAFQEQALADRLGQAQPKVVITNKELKKRLPNGSHIIAVDSDDFVKSLEHASDELGIAEMNPDD